MSKQVEEWQAHYIIYDHFPGDPKRVDRRPATYSEWRQYHEITPRPSHPMQNFPHFELMPNAHYEGAEFGKVMVLGDPLTELDGSEPMLDKLIDFERGKS